MTAGQPGKASAIALAVALLLTGASGVLADHADGTEMVTTGHTTYIQANTGYNKCFAGLTGALIQRVTWFNGQTLFSRMSEGDGDTYMYAMEALRKETNDGYDQEAQVKPFDPTEVTLYDTGNEWVIEDPNDHKEDGEVYEWRIGEYYALRDEKGGTGAYDTEGEQVASVEQEKIYVYVVQVGPTITDSHIHRDYNFVSLVDTCRFHQDNGTVEHNNRDTGDGVPDQPHEQHDSGNTEGTHNHSEFDVDLFVGGKPSSVPAPEQATRQIDTDDGNESEANGGASS